VQTSAECLTDASATLLLDESNCDDWEYLTEEFVCDLYRCDYLTDPMSVYKRSLVDAD
jgi:hypothetical protein